MQMIVHKGVRYRPDDAKRLGLDTPKPAAKLARKARNKARTVVEDATGGDDPAA